MNTKDIFHSLKQGILICDHNSQIIYFNDAYGEFINQSLDEVKGHKITEYRLHAMIPEVIQTMKPIEGMIRKEENQQYFACVYPIIEDGRIQGTISLVTTLAQHQLKVSSKSRTLAERVHQFEREEILTEVELYGGGVEGKRAAAEKLGISLATLYNKLKEG